ncbi:MAG: hypothetical protein BWY21_00983 [Parcubacteria group bacterium ADurb.Bin216]|nr:MAG: hypothetical protein BWY21_00983 [Parcubacteria group bacterium ADurb.Bin216]
MATNNPVFNILTEKYPNLSPEMLYRIADAMEKDWAFSIRRIEDILNYSTLASVLMAGFLWEKSEMGTDYWQDIYDTCNKLGLKPVKEGN